MLSDKQDPSFDPQSYFARDLRIGYRFSPRAGKSCAERIVKQGIRTLCFVGAVLRNKECSICNVSD